jgi:hypothetical protein
MHIDLHAVQDDLPEGMNRVLSMLEQASIPDSGPPADGPSDDNAIATFTVDAVGQQTAFDVIASSVPVTGSGAGNIASATVTVNNAYKVTAVSSNVNLGVTTGWSPGDVLILTETGGAGMVKITVSTVT